MKLDPSLARPHWVVGQSYLRAEPPDREAALKEFRELVRKGPRWDVGHSTLANTLLQQGRKAEGLKSMREVLRRKPDNAWARRELSKHLLERGEYREAVARLFIPFPLGRGKRGRVLAESNTLSLPSPNGRGKEKDPLPAPLPRGKGDHPSLFTFHPSLLSISSAPRMRTS